MKDIDIVSVLFVFLAGLIAYIFGLNVHVLEIDSAQYASISCEMLNNGSYLQVKHRLLDYLDKPPLLFWLSALSFKLIGISDFAFKLPSFLFTLLGLFSTYKFSLLYYNRLTGLVSSIILFTCTAFFQFNQDVRTDAILTGSIMFAIWQLSLYLRNKRVLNFLLGFIGIALAMLSKGPIGIMVPILGLGTHLMMQKQWDEIFNFKWIIGLIFLSILLLPMTIGLYEQFGWKGVKFYYWTQSFGRLTGENVWKNDTGYFYFVHTYLWAFLPWSIIGIAGLIRELKTIYKLKFKLNFSLEIITLAGVIFPFIALSMSKYKLPHYIFVLFPLLSIISGKYIVGLLSELNDRIINKIFYGQLLMQFIMWMISFFLIFRAFQPENPIIYFILLILLFLNVFFLIQKKVLFNKLIISSALASISCNLLLNIYVFPELISYQSGVQASELIMKNNYKKLPIISYKAHSYSLDFYTEQVIPNYENSDSLKRLINKTNYCLFTTEKGFKEIVNLLPKPIKIYNLTHYHVSKLNLKFLNPETRHSQLQHRYLLKY